MRRDYYIFSNGRLKRKDNTIYFIDFEDNKKALPVEQVENIHMFGEVDLNSMLLNYMAKFGVKIHFYNYYGFFSGTYYTRKKNVSGYTVVSQARFYIDCEKRINLARKFILSAIHHILRNMRKHKSIDGDLIKAIDNEKVRLNDAKSIPEVMGIEGRIRKRYYSSFNDILKNGFTFEKREKRPPKDPINAMVSFGNSIMYTTVLSELYKTQLDPTISFLHEPSTKRFSLSLDIAEIFKPLIIDPIIFSLVNNRIINKRDFDFEGDICFLNENGRKKFLKEYEKKMEITIKHRRLNRKVSYRTFIRLECYKLIKHFIGDEEYKPLKAWW